jgi:hypothetical protein
LGAGTFVLLAARLGQLVKSVIFAAGGLNRFHLAGRISSTLTDKSSLAFATGGLSILQQRQLLDGAIC